MSGLLNSIGNIFTGGTGTTGQNAANISSPFNTQYSRYQQPLWNLVNNPSSVTQTPGYQFQFDQGMQGLMRTEAAQGNLEGGGALAAAQQYGQNFASTF